MSASREREREREHRSRADQRSAGGRPMELDVGASSSQEHKAPPMQEREQPPSPEELAVQSLREKVLKCFLVPPSAANLQLVPEFVSAGDASATNICLLQKTLERQQEIEKWASEGGRMVNTHSCYPFLRLILCLVSRCSRMPSDRFACARRWTSIYFVAGAADCSACISSRACSSICTRHRCMCSHLHFEGVFSVVRNADSTSGRLALAAGGLRSGLCVPEASAQR